MNSNDQFCDSHIVDLAIRQLADYDACDPGTLFAEGLEIGISDAYRLQSAVVDLRIARGERTVGFKVGCTSPTIREQLGIAHSISGRLYEAERHPDSAKLSRGQFENLAIEGELALELSRTPVIDDFQVGTIPACVRRVFPVVELHNHVIRGKKTSAGELIANNAIHAGFVCGEGIPAEQVDRADEELSLEIFAGDRLIAGCEGVGLVQSIHSSLRWLLDHAAIIGQSIEADDIVLTGSIPALIPVGENCDIKVATQPFGDVTVEFVD